MHPLAPLHARPQWIVVLLAPKADGKKDKIPVDYRHCTPGANAHDPAVWTTHANALAIAQSLGVDFTVGFVLTDNDPFWCLDIDGALVDGAWSPLAQQLCGALAGSVVEVSQSGTGLHIWGHWKTPIPHSMKNVPLRIEFYSSKRFIAIGDNAAGQMLEEVAGLPAILAYYFKPRGESAGEIPDEGPRSDWRGPTDDEELIRRALRSRSAGAVFNGKACFADLWTRNEAVLAQAYPDTGGRPYDASSADSALAQHLAFWTGCDAARMERLMRRSELVRDKYDREGYLYGNDWSCINAACRMQVDVLKDRAMEPLAGETWTADQAAQLAAQAAPPYDPRSHVAAPPAPSAAPAAPVAPPPPAEAPVASVAHVAKAVEGTTFLTPEQQAELFKGCVYVEDANKILVPNGSMLKQEQFRARYGGYTFIMDARNERTSRNAWEAFTETQALRHPRADGYTFQPKLPPGAIIKDAGRTRVNTWCPVEIPRQKGDATLFWRHLELLLPDKQDRQYALCYMAAVVQHQGIKFQWAPVFQGVEGNGKTLLSRCVAEAVGRRYTFWPSAAKIAKQFNGWLIGHTFFAVEDIHTSANVDVIEQLKPMITGGDGIEIEKKGVDQTTADICGNFIFNTNHKNGLRKTRNDRRFAIFFTAQQTEADLVRDGMDGNYMQRLYDWLKFEGGYAIVAEILWTFPIPDHLNPAKGLQRAPKTSATEAAIEASYGSVEQEVIEAIEREDVGFRGGWVSSGALDRLLGSMGRGAVVPPNRRRDMLQSLGYDWHPALPSGRVNNPVLPDAAKVRLYAKVGASNWALASAAEVAHAYQQAQGVALPGR
jgi:hypothetical protein